LAITVVADQHPLATLQQRVSSWFTDGTQVTVAVTSEVDEERLLASTPSEVRVWILPLRPERALVTFSSVTPQTPARHLVREVRLRNGLDDLGLERLASVIHSAFVALRDGADGVERAQAERELGEAGVTPGSKRAPVELAARMVEPRPVPVAPSQSSEIRRAPALARETPIWLLLGAGYGGRLRGPESLGHGPSLALGLQLPSKRAAIDLLVSGQFLFRSAFEAELFEASVQTTALRFQFGIEPALGSSFFAQALVGAGADIAQVHASSLPTSGTAHRLPHSTGTQLRSAGELTLGVLRRGELLDLGVYAQLNFLLEDVHYSATTDTGEQRLVTPWPIQPGLFLQGRFRSAL